MTQKPPKLLLRIRVFLFCEVYILPLPLIKLTLIHGRDIHLFSGQAVWLSLSSYTSLHGAKTISGSEYGRGKRVPL